MNELKAGNEIYENKQSSASLIIIKALFESLSSVTVENDPLLNTPFKITKGEVYTKSVIQGRVTTKTNIENPKIQEIDHQKCIKTNQPSQEIHITLNLDSFTSLEIPNLIRELTKAHNESVKNLNPNQFEHLDISKSKSYQMNPGLIIAKRYIAVAKILDKALKISEDGIGTSNSFIKNLYSGIQDVKNFVEHVANQYQIDSINLDVNIDPLKEEKIINFLKKVRPEGNASIERRIPRLFKLINQNIEEATEQDLLTAIFERSRAEIMRLVNIDKLLEDFEHTEGLKLRNMKHEFDSEVNINKKVEIQIRFAKAVSKFVYDKSIFPYRPDYPDLKKIAEQRFVNCVTRAYLQYTIHQKYFDKQLLGASTDEHFFAILPLADNTFFVLEKEPFVLKYNHGESVSKLKYLNINTDYPWPYFNSGNFEKLYTAAVLNNLGSSYDTDIYTRYLLLSTALKLNPEDNGILSSLATLYKDNANYFIEKFGSRENVLLEAERLYILAIEMLENDNSEYVDWVKLCLAELYYYSLNRTQDALLFYKEVLENKENNPNIPIHLTKDDVIETINLIKNS